MQVQNDERLIRRPNNNGNGINLGVGSIVAVIALRDGAGMRYGHDRVIRSGSHAAPLNGRRANQRSSSCSGTDAEPCEKSGPPHRRTIQMATREPGAALGDHWGPEDY